MGLDLKLWKVYLKMLGFISHCFMSYSEDKDDKDSGPTEVFFFPTSMMGAAMEDVDAPESALKLPSPSSPHREITVQTSSCGSLASSTNSEDTEHYSADEEFCIIDDPGLGIAVCVNQFDSYFSGLDPVLYVPINRKQIKLMVF